MAPPTIVKRDEPGGRHKMKHRPQRKIVPQLDAPKKKDVVTSDDKKESEDLGFIDKETKIKIEKPRIKPVRKEKPVVINEVQPGKQLENIPGQSSSEIDLRKKEKSEGAPIPIFPTGKKKKPAKVLGKVSDLPPGRKKTKSPISAVIPNTSVDDVLSSVEKVAKEGYYIVKEDDTLYSIARINNTTVEAIRYWNGLRGNEIEIGQELKITGRN
mgnify:CR=1 FL=1